MDIKYKIFRKIWCGISKLNKALGYRLWKVYMKEAHQNDYEETAKIWETKKVHPNFQNPAKFYEDINTSMHFKKEDVVFDIGCGDGVLDSYIPCKVYGIDGADSKIEEARKNNPAGTYVRQSFFDDFQSEMTSGVNKVFSYGVFQYCKPEDTDMLLRNSIKALDFNNIEEGIVGHLSIPDITRAWAWYQWDFGISEKEVNENKELLRYIFPEDGSYWHNLEELVDRSENIINELDIKGFGHKTLLTKSESFYRHNLIIYFWKFETWRKTKCL